MRRRWSPAPQAMAQPFWSPQVLVFPGVSTHLPGRLCGSLCVCVLLSLWFLCLSLLNTLGPSVSCALSNCPICFCYLCEPLCFSKLAQSLSVSLSTALPFCVSDSLCQSVSLNIRVSASVSVCLPSLGIAGSFLGLLQEQVCPDLRPPQESLLLFHPVCL